MNSIDDLYARVPDMKCKPGCTDCCTHVAWSPEEFDRLPGDRKLLHFRLTFSCPHLEEGVGCKVYDNRPLWCRIFATYDGADCPHGCGPEKKLTREEAIEIMLAYKEMFCLTSLTN